MNIYAVIPVFNENTRIRPTLKSVAKYVDKVVLVDDGSWDSTSKIESSGKIVVLRHEINLGQGAALQTGFDFAKENDANIVVTFDGDGQFLASDIPTVVAPLLNNQADIVFGSRFLGKSINMPWSKKATLKLAIFFTSLYSGVSLSDTHNGFRALNEKALRKINLSQNRMAHASEIIHQTKTKKLKLIEVPVTILYNKHTIQKGQKLTNLFWILFDLIFKKI